MTTNSTWAALRNPTFRKLWIAAVISGTCVAAHDSAATWMMNLVFSPHAWGWSGTGGGHCTCGIVLPTRVGMVRHVVPLATETMSSPPHAWGWSSKGSVPPVMMAGSSHTRGDDSSSFPFTASSRPNDSLVYRLSNNYTYPYAAFFRRFFGFVHPGEISSSR